MLPRAVKDLTLDELGESIAEQVETDQSTGLPSGLIVDRSSIGYLADKENHPTTSVRGKKLGFSTEQAFRRIVDQGESITFCASVSNVHDLKDDRKKITGRGGGAVRSGGTRGGSQVMKPSRHLSRMQVLVSLSFPDLDGTLMFCLMFMICARCL